MSKSLKYLNIQLWQVKYCLHKASIASLCHSICGQCLHKSFEGMPATSDTTFATVAPSQFDFT